MKIERIPPSPPAPTYNLNISEVERLALIAALRKMEAIEHKGSYQKEQRSILDTLVYGAKEG